MKITCSSARLRAKFDVLGENHDKKVMGTKKIISQSQQHAIEKKVIVKNILGRCKAAQHVCTSACYKEKENAQNDLNQVNSNLHAGFVIIFDNIDGKLNKRHMTKDNQNYDYHWINHKVAMNRVSGNKFDPSPRNVLDVPNIKLLPTIQDQSRQRYNYIVLVARMLVEHLDSFKMFKDVCVYHIPHKYSREMAMKSETVSTNVKT